MTQQTKMNRRKFVTVGAGAVTVAAAAAAGYYYATSGPPSTVVETTPITIVQTVVPKPKYGGKLVVATQGPTENLDPAITPSVSSYQLLMHTNEGLVQTTTSGDISPVLAESWEPKDGGKTWDFKLRQGVKFHNGQELTADDVVFTFQRLLDQKAVASWLPNLQSVEKVDNYTVRFTNSQPFAAMLIGLAYERCIIIPKTTDKIDFATTAIGTGPFRLAERQVGVLERFVANKDYWGKDADGNRLPYVDEMDWTPTTDATVRFLTFRGGKADFIVAVDPKDFPALQREPNTTVYQTWGFIPIVCFDTKSKIFSSQKLRRAVSYAIDRREIMDLVLRGLAEEQQGSIMRPDNKYYYPVPTAVYDPDKAKQLIIDAGYPSGLKVTMLTYQFWPAGDVSKVVIDQLKRVGIQAELNNMDLGVYIDKIIINNWDNHTQDGIAVNIDGHFVDPAIELNLFFHSKGSFNWWGPYERPELDKLLDQGAAELDADKRVEIYKQAQTLQAEDPAQIPICTMYKVQGQKTYVKGNFFQDGYNYPIWSNLWLEK